MSAPRRRFNPGQDLADADRALRRFVECMENRDRIDGDPPDDMILQIWQHHAHEIGSGFANAAYDLWCELDERLNPDTTR